MESIDKIETLSEIIASFGILVLIITGNPLVWASIKTIPSPSNREGKTKISNADSNDPISSLMPVNITESSIDSSFTLFFIHSY